MLKREKVALFLSFYPFASRNNPVRRILFGTGTGRKIHKTFFLKTISTFFDEKVWTKETHEPGWTNQELQAYDAAHVSVGKNGDKSVLILTAERKGNKIYSGRINSKGKRVSSIAR